MYILAFVRRALRLRDETIVPAVCYATCNNAYLEAQSVDLSPELCAPNSAFLVSYNACLTCVTQNGDNDTSQVYIEPKFAPFVDFCSTSGTNATGTGPNATEAAIFSSQVSLLAYVASVASAASSLGLLNATATVVVTVIPTVFPTFTGATQTSSPKATSAPEASSKAWIAGAVAGPTLLLLLTVGIWVLRRKWKSQHQQGVVLHQPEKAQLHADGVVKPTYELEGEGEVQSVSELPAREPVGNELDARRGGGRDLG